MAAMVRLAHQAGLVLTVLVNARCESITGDAQQALTLLSMLPVKIDFCPESEAMAIVVVGFQERVIVDCLFGIGFGGVLSPALIDLIAQINNQSCPRVSVDMPSGLMPT
jgi:NAD(P)H-hydrate repair Nnr-like enzyme with NAD(P)H-hydrate epimerase domain